jgi:hypothetical protein
MTMQIPALLVLVATALMAVAIFAPKKLPAPATISYAPSIAALVDVPPVVHREPQPAWPAYVDPCAAGCDAAARLALVDALETLRAPWADAILLRALADEPDAIVRAAAQRAVTARYATAIE